MPVATVLIVPLLFNVVKVAVESVPEAPKLIAVVVSTSPSIVALVTLVIDVDIVPVFVIVVILASE